MGSELQQTLSGFSTHYGVQVAVLGDDGDLFIALGHVEKRRALAAFARMCRVDLGWTMDREINRHRVNRVNIDEELRHELWTVATGCGECDSDPDCIYCKTIAAADWWLRKAAAGEVAFPVTVFEW